MCSGAWSREHIGKMKKLDLTGKTAVVTGGAGQIGRTICKALADCGANIGICYHSQADAAAALQKKIESEYGVKSVAAQGDVTNRKSLEEMKRQVNDKLGTVDIIVNNAIISNYNWETVLNQDVESYEVSFRTCTIQAVLMSQVFAPDMVKRKYGRIIGINTECTMQMMPYQSAYVAGKRSMDGIYRVLAREVGPHNVTVNQVAPGWTITDSNRNPDPSLPNLKQTVPYVSLVPMGRRVTDEEVANAICFLASDLASSITGMFLSVSGGAVMPTV